MTATERTLLRAEIALLRSVSPTKGAAGRYSDEAWRRALARVAARQTMVAPRGAR